MKHQV